MQISEEFDLYLKEIGMESLTPKDREYELIREAFNLGVFKSFCIFMDEVSISRIKTLQQFVEEFEKFLEWEQKKE